MPLSPEPTSLGLLDWQASHMAPWQVLRWGRRGWREAQVSSIYHRWQGQGLGTPWEAPIIVWHPAGSHSLPDGAACHPRYLRCVSGRTMIVMPLALPRGNPRDCLSLTPQVKSWMLLVWKEIIQLIKEKLLRKMSHLGLCWLSRGLSNNKSWYRWQWK